MTRPIAADTHAILWYLTGSPRLSATAKAAFDDAVEAPQDIYISAMSLVELVYLTERSRIPLTAAALGAPLVTCDTKILASNTETIW